MNRARAGRRLAAILAGPAVAAEPTRRHTLRPRSKRHLALTAVMVPLMAGGALIASGPGASSAATCVSWTGAQPPSAGSFSVLQGAAVVSSCSAWGVGYYYDGTAYQTLIDRWNGSSWVQQTSQNPSGTARTNQLTAVTATSTKNAWAVGNYYNGSAYESLIEHWNGSNWTQQLSVNPSTTSNYLQAVKATSASNAWAVGYYYNGTANRTLIEHWNGSSWKRVSSPNAGTTDELTAVAATSTTDAWAIGYDYNGTGFSTLTEHWNGSTWKRVSSPNPGGTHESNILFGVTATATNNAWAVGYDYNGVNYQSVILHWNGSKWKHVTSPNPSTLLNILLAVKATSASNAWAVGYYYDGSHEETFITHYNGHSWTKVGSPTLGSTYSELTAIGASSASSIWSVGEYYNGSEDQGMAVHCC
jgi:hypothetical protein